MATADATLAQQNALSIAAGDLERAEFWLKCSIESLMSLWQADRSTFMRSTDDQSGDFRPTASLHAFDALHVSGMLTTREGERGQGAYVCPSGLDVPTAASLLDALISPNTQNTGTSRRQAFPSWLDRIYEGSSHTKSIVDTSSSRETIVLAPLCRALSGIFQDFDEKTNNERKSAVKNGLFVIKQRVEKLLSTGEIDNPTFWQSATMLGNAAECAAALKGLAEQSGFADCTVDDGALLNKLDQSLQRHIDYHMARRHVELDASFDPLALCNAIRGLLLVDPTHASGSYMLACLNSVIEAQLPDGCWPDGASVTFEATGDVVQQPSLGVALMLAESAISERSLVDIDGNDHAALDYVLPALRRSALYLRTMHQTVRLSSGRKYSGWSSDRTRRKGLVETWITAMAVRFFFRLWLGERAALRGIALKRLDQGEFRARELSADEVKSRWEATLSEPDSITRPILRVFTQFIEPILSQRRQALLLQRPSHRAISFILFGPPGSGKTYFVERIADLLNWPLVSLTPGHFIRHGLDAIESTTREIFNNLLVIDHAVVFFDECDELFRERGSESGGFRSILSFATASMLPKLQSLHDHGRVLFIVGTNYLRNIDTAIRRPGRFDDILLFDRPDETARRKILISNSVPAESIDSHVRNSSGLTFPEVVKYAQAVASGKEPPKETSLGDYQDWCIKEGDRELQGSRFTESVKDQIRQRWKANMPQGLSG